MIARHCKQHALYRCRPNRLTRIRQRARCCACIAAPADIMTESYAQGRGALCYPHELDVLDVDCTGRFSNRADLD